MHVGLGRSHPLHIEYIHLGACLSFIQDILTEAILSHPRLPLPRKIALVKAIGKIVWIQNDLFAKWHIREGVEFAVDDDLIEEEGYVHSKKILSDSDEGEGAVSSSTLEPGVCPFSAVVNGIEELRVEEHDWAQVA